MISSMVSDPPRTPLRVKEYLGSSPSFRDPDEAAPVGSRGLDSAPVSPPHSNLAVYYRPPAAAGANFSQDVVASLLRMRDSRSESQEDSSASSAAGDAPAVSHFPGGSAPAVSHFPGGSAPAVSHFPGASAPAVNHFPGGSAPAVSHFSGSSAPAVSHFPGGSAPAVSRLLSGVSPLVPGGPFENKRSRKSTGQSGLRMRNGSSSRVPASGKRGAKSRREEVVVEIEEEEEEEEEEDYEEEEDEERAKASQLISRLRQVTMEETR
jgi:hypothetical protein